MPGASGQAVLHAARSRHSSMPVIMMSAVPVHKPTVDERFDAYLQKPVSLADLRNTIATLLSLPRADQLATSSAIDVAALRRPAQDQLDEARMLAELGAVSDLMDWAEKIASLDPTCESFVAKVRQLAKRGEFDELKAMLINSSALGGAALFEELRAQ